MMEENLIIDGLERSCHTEVEQKNDGSTWRAQLASEMLALHYKIHW